MILITGASGFIGKNLVLRVAASERLRILVRRTSRIELFRGKKNIEIVYGILETGADLDQALDGCSVVVHCAARTSGRTYREFYDTNTLGTCRLLSAMGRKGIHKLLFLSSYAACGTDPGNNPIDETHSANPNSIYGLTKKLAEEAIKKSNVRFTLLRPCAVYGPYDTEILKYLKLLNIGICPVVGSAEKYVNMLYVGDLVKLMLEVISKDHFDGETYFVSDGQAYSHSEVFAEICKALGRNRLLKIHVPLSAAKLFALLNEVLLPERQRIIDRDKINAMAEDSWVCSSVKVAQELGFKPEYTFAAGIAKTINWYRANGYLNS